MVKVDINDTDKKIFQTEIFNQFHPIVMRSFVQTVRKENKDELKNITKSKIPDLQKPQSMTEESIIIKIKKM